MPAEVLICHAPEDAVVAEGLRAALAGHHLDVAAWSAGSTEWEAARTPGLAAVVVVYSARAVANLPMAWQLGQFARHRRPIVVVRVDESPLLGALEPLLRSSPHVEATVDRRGAAARLVELVRGLVGAPAELRNGAGAKPPEAAPDTRYGRPARETWPPRVLAEAPGPAPDGRLRPHSLKGWVVSLSLHLLVIAALAFGVLKSRPREDRSFDAAIVGVDPRGDFAGWTEQMGGLEFPELDTRLVADEPVLTTAPVPKFQFEADLVRLPGESKTTGQGGGKGGDGFGTSVFGPGTEVVRGVKVRTGDPQFTLLWDAKVDLDLHVTEPGGEHIFWISKGKKTRQGGMLDVDNVTGFGPENIFWEHGQGPPGEYRWYVEYFGGFGGLDVPTRWQVRIKQDGVERVIDGRFRKNGEKSKVYTLRVLPRPVGEKAPRDETPRD